MNFKEIEYNKKFDKNHFELNSLLKMNKDIKEQKSTTNQSNSQNDINNNSSNNNTNNTTTNNNTNPENNMEESSNTTNNNNNTNNSNTTTNNESKQETDTKTTASINDIVYPMHLPHNTYLTSQEKIDTESGERLILTFGGDSSFILVEETSKIENENVVIPVSGEFDFLTDVIGIITNKSLSWHSNGIDYYLTSDVIKTAELIDIARSISILPVSK